MSATRYATIAVASALALSVAADRCAAQLVIPWYTIDGGGGMFSTDGQPGGFVLSGTIGQPDAGVTMTDAGGQFALTGGFWPGAASGAGAPAANITAAASRKANTGGPGGVCDLPLVPSVKSEPRQGGVTELRVTFDMAPGAPGSDPVTIEQRVCPAPGTYVPYSGSAVVSGSIAGNELVLTFTPGLENLRTYRITMNPSVTSVAGQFVEVRGLIGDTDGNGLVNAVDRALIVGAWTSPAGFTCTTDLDSSSRTNAVDRALVVGAWTAPSNCAP